MERIMQNYYNYDMTAVIGGQFSCAFLKPAGTVGGFAF